MGVGMRARHGAHSPKLGPKQEVLVIGLILSALERSEKRNLSGSLIMENIFLLWLPKRKRVLQFSRSVVSNSLQPHGLQHARFPCPSPTPGVYSNSCPLSQWCHPTISSTVIPFSSCLQSFPASGSFPMSQFFASVFQDLGFLKGFLDTMPKV